MDWAGALICNNDKILMILRDNDPSILNPNSWQLPGGGIEEGETPEEAMKRELQEEVCFVPKDIHFLESFKDGKNTAYIYWVFVTDDEIKNFHLGDEGQEIRFFTVPQLEKIKMASRLKLYLQVFRTQLIEALKTKTFNNFKE